ncbi:MAG: glycosyl transferase family protein, partial [Acidimicrobiales bacterium]|nr:glycosyl transferase family protein [Acidimicrobiales bacterium]
MNLWVSMIVRNEADRHLERVLGAAASLDAAGIIVTDDASTDRTREVLDAFGCIMQTTAAPMLWEHEGRARQRHLAFVDRQAHPGDWVLALDADETVNVPGAVVGVVEQAVDERKLVVGLRLYEFWSETAYRVDGRWFGAVYPCLYAWQP